METQLQTQSFIISEDLDGTRLDKALAILMSPMSRSRIQSLINDNHVAINNQFGKWGSSKVRTNMLVTIKVPEMEPLDITEQNLNLDVVFEDDHLLVVNKPAGMVVHPAPGNYSGTLVNGLMYHCKGTLAGIGGVKRPGIVHRIDKDTSGLLVVAKDDNTHSGLTALFQKHDIDRLYSAYVYGVPNPVNATIEGNIGRHPKDRKKMAIVENGKSSKTHYKVLQNFKNVACHIECKLETGRTHQIRVHMSSRSHCLIGDTTYGKIQKNIKNLLSKEEFLELQAFNRQALHAKTLGFVHPITKENLYFESSLPQDMIALDTFLKGL